MIPILFPKPSPFFEDWGNFWIAIDWSRIMGRPRGQGVLPYREVITKVVNEKIDTVIGICFTVFSCLDASVNGVATSNLPFFVEPSCLGTSWKSWKIAVYAGIISFLHNPAALETAICRIWSHQCQSRFIYQRLVYLKNHEPCELVELELLTDEFLWVMSYRELLWFFEFKFSWSRKKKWRKKRKSRTLEFMDDLAGFYWLWR